MRLLIVSFAVLTLVACGGAAPTPTPAFARYTAAGVVAALGVAGAQEGQRAAAEPWPNVQADWLVFPYAGISAQQRGGQVLTYRTPEDLAAMRAYLDRLPADVKVYSYTRHNTLLFLSSRVPKAEADKLRDAFDRLP